MNVSHLELGSSEEQILDSHRCERKLVLRTLYL